MSNGGVWLRIRSVKFEGGQVCEEDCTCMGVGGFCLRAWRKASGRVKTPLQEVNVGSGPLTSFEAMRRLFHIPTTVVGCWARKRKDKLRVCSGCAVDPIVCGERYDGTERKWIIGVSKPP